MIEQKYELKSWRVEDQSIKIPASIKLETNGTITEIAFDHSWGMHEILEYLSIAEKLRILGTSNADEII